MIDQDNTYLPPAPQSGRTPGATDPDDDQTGLWSQIMAVFRDIGGSFDAFANDAHPEVRALGRAARQRRPPSSDDYFALGDLCARLTLNKNQLNEAYLAKTLAAYTQAAEIDRAERRPARVALQTFAQWVVDTARTLGSYDALKAGETQVLTIPFTATDVNGATSNTANLAITITGTNDVPVASAAVNAVDEDATITGNVTATDDDAGETATLSYALTDAAPAGLTFNPDGSYSFDASSYDSLTAGETQVLTIPFTASDAWPKTSRLQIGPYGSGRASNLARNLSTNIPRTREHAPSPFAAPPQASKAAKRDAGSPATRPIPGAAAGIGTARATHVISPQRRD